LAMAQRQIAIIIPSCGRPWSLSRLLRSLREYAPGATLVTVVQDGHDPEVRPDVLLRAAPGYSGPRRRMGAEAVPDAAGYLHLDDDHEALPGLGDALEEMMSLSAVSLPMRRGWPPRSMRVAAMSGGMWVRGDAYWMAGGHGEDYLDDLELSLRLRAIGVLFQRWPKVLTRHHGGIPGGLRGIDAVQPKRTAHLRLSRLDEHYPVLRDERSWWGYRLI